MQRNASIASFPDRQIIEQFDAVAGGGTAGIPFAAWKADKLDLQAHGGVAAAAAA